MGGLFFETGSYYIDLIDLELSIETRLGSDSQAISLPVLVGFLLYFLFCFVWFFGQLDNKLEKASMRSPVCRSVGHCLAW